jgi:flagellar basal body-associated protein FliL
MKKSIGIILIILVIILIAGNVVAIFYAVRKYNNSSDVMLQKVQLKYGFTTDANGNIYFSDGTNS